MAYQFLSDEWVEAARKIWADAASPPLAPQPVTVNLTITQVPFGDGLLDAHMDTTSGELQLELGHLERSDVSATLDYETARAMIVDADPQVAMQAFMAGKIMLQGDLTKVMSLQGVPSDPGLARKLQEITD